MNSSTYILLFSLMWVYACQNDQALFRQLPAEKTGIDFSNIITETDSFNILSYEYIYNGGGVAIADFDQNGFQDIFFTGNMVDNRLYLNQGDWRFKDVSTEAGIRQPDRWNSGVAVVDINLDGLPDLYLCATTYSPAGRRTNALLINQGTDEAGIPTFVNEAEAYGLADTTHTTHAAFFDFDKDGDLDLYLLVNEMDEERLPNRYRKKITDGSSRRTDRLYRNDFNESLEHAFFTDISREAGILTEGFGLGLNITDINRDGWPDIYVTNDYLTNDLLYINNGDGSFTDQSANYFKHTSHSAMGNDVGDINNDGLVDIVAVDMLPEDNFRRKTMLPPNNYTAYANNDRFGYQYQYIRNTLQLNKGPHPVTGVPIFSEIAMLAGISSTDWSWAPMLLDFDQDGLRDLIITNGFPKDVTDRDFMDYHTEVGRYASPEFILKKIPEVKLKNYAYRNRGNLQFEKMTADWGITQPSFSNGAAYGDLDNDGDMDYVVNNINDPAFVFRNFKNEMKTDNANWIKFYLQGSPDNPTGIGAFIEIHCGNNRQVWEHTPYRGYLSSVQQVAHFGIGTMTQVDRVLVHWPNGRHQIWENLRANESHELIMFDQSTGIAVDEQVFSPPLYVDLSNIYLDSFVHEELDYIDFNVQPLLPHKLSQYGPGIAVGDVNADGLDDFFLGDSHFKAPTFFIQQAEGRFSKQELIPKTTEEKGETLGSLFFDADNDGDQDLYLVRGGYEFAAEDSSYQDRLYLNDGGQYRLAAGALPSFLSSGSCVKAADYDRDGDLDLFVGGRVHPHHYPRAVDSHLLRNDSEKGKLKFTLTEQDLLRSFGMVCDALWTDFDNDGWVDLLIAGEWMPIKVLKNEAGRLRDVSATSGLEEQVGWWNSLTGADFDQDGDIDYIAGNLGLNTLNKATKDQPIAIYAADFDNNGGYDAVPTAYFPDQEGRPGEFPFFGRMDVQKQINKVKGQFIRHEEFAKAPVEKVLTLTPEVLQLKANYLVTSYIENQGDGKFAIKALPVEAQFAPIYGTIAKDVNKDGHLDIILSGNDYATEVSMGRYDALNGLVLSGDGTGKFRELPISRSGIYIPGDGKALAEVKLADGNTILLASQNRALLKVFKQSGPEDLISAGPFDHYAMVTLRDGSSYRQEFYYGHSFLSQSSRFLAVPEKVERIVFVDFQGAERRIPEKQLEN